MAERPILFSGPMVQAILDGRKTQTRRVVKLQPVSTANVSGGLMWGHEKLGGMFAESVFPGCFTKLVPCPYGQPGDRLWVREAWHPSNHVPFGTRADYLADTPDARGEGFWKWKPSIHMPRWASRITLEITAVRVERLQAISDHDAFAEGLQSYVDTHRGHTGGDGSARYTFAAMWDKINGKSRPWKSNPWVWVVEFRKAVSGGE